MKRRDLIKFSIASAIALNFHTRKAQASSWSYQGETGTDFWGELNPEFQACGSGRAQSPINIEGSGFSLDVGSLDLNYQDVPLTIVNNGKTIRVDYQPGSSLTLDDREYELLQFHFHQPSEHLISGKTAAMEAHFVHQNRATGDLVVLAVMMSEGQRFPALKRPGFLKDTAPHMPLTAFRGKTNRAIESIWQHPQADSQQAVSNLTINALQLLPPDSKSYYRYQGSLTTPPCSEIVTWLVLKQPIFISKSQLCDFNKVIGNNARPVQALNQRSLLQFNY